MFKKIILFLVFVSLCVKSFTQQIQFNALTVQDGLSQHDVSSVLQDSEGFLWIGTYDGLNRFDGYEVTNFFHKNESTASLSSNRIVCLFEDNRQRIWSGTDGYGLNFYSLKDGTFTRVKVPENYEIIKDIKQTKENELLVATENGLIKVITENDTIVTEVMQTPLTGISIRKINILPNKSIVFATSRGLWLYKDDKYSVIESTENSSFKNVVHTTNGNLWAGSNKGLYKVVKNKAKKLKNLVNKNILSLSKGIKGDLWISTFKSGLIHMDLSSETIQNIEGSDKTHHFSLQNNPINTLFLDTSNTLWVSNRKGMLYSNLENEKFNSLPIIRKAHVRTLFATENKVYYGVQSDKFYVYNFNDKTNQTIDLIKNAKPFKIDTLNGKIHLATTKGLYKETKMGSNNFEIAPIFNDVSKNKNQIITSFCIDKFGNEYYGSFKGLIFKDKSGTNLIEERFENFKIFRNIRVFSLKADNQKNVVWVGTISKGLFKINLSEKGKVLSFESYNEQMTGSYNLPNNTIWCFYEDKIGDLFIGTDTGLLRKKKNESEFHIVKANHITNKKIMGIVDDSKGNLWLSNSQGIIKYTTNSNTSQLYNYNDGLLTNTFTEAIGKNSKSELFFGSILGINHFNPQELIINPFPSKIAFTDLYVNNLLVNVNDTIAGSIILNKRLNKTDEIKLNYKQDDFSIEFTSTNFANVKVNEYRYKLIGFDKSWQEVSNSKRFATYSRIPSGSYTFVAEATNPDGNWSGLQKEIKIKVAPAPWKTWWAYLFYCLILASIVFTLLFFWQNKQKLRNQIELSKLKNQQESEINEMKLVFFTDVAHEFKTPLSLIIGPIDDLIKNNTTKEQREFCYNILSRNTNRMMNLVNQLLDFRKINSGINILRVSRNDLCAFIKEISKSFEWQAKSTGIDLRIISPESYFCHFDKDILEKVIYNLLSNAFKYTPYGGIIEIEIKPTWRQDLEYFIILIKDSGKGISQTDKRKIFERYVHGKDRSSSGIGLHLTASLITAHKGEINVLNSSLGGTEFMITLPVSSKAFTEEEFLTKDDIPLVIPEHFTPGETVETKEEIEENGKEKILIVEDDHDLRKYLRNILLGDYKVVEAINGIKGYEMCLQEIPDFIITDVMMPELDGVEMCKKIKENILISHIPILMLTAKTGEEFYNKGLKVGAWDYIAKPFNTLQLLQKVKNISETRNNFRLLISKGSEEETKNHYVSYDQKFVQKARGIVVQKMSDPTFSVEILASELGLSRMQLHRKLKTLIGANTTAFINSIRIKEAIQMFDDGCDRVQEAMDSVGINSYAHFITLFKKEKEMTPKKYIETISKQNKSVH